MNSIWNPDIIDDMDAVFNDLDNIWMSSDVLDFFNIESPHDLMNERTLSSDDEAISDLASIDSISTASEKPQQGNKRQAESETQGNNSQINKSIKIAPTQMLSEKPGGELREIPKKLSSYINCGDISSIQKLVDQYFEVGCVVRTPGPVAELIGKQYVFLLFESLLQSFPDYVFVAKKIRSTDTMIACKTTFTGTKAVVSKNEHLFKPAHCNLVNEILKHKKISADEEAVLRKLQEALYSEKVGLLLWGGGAINMTYNPSTMRISRFEMTMTISSFKRSFMKEED